jgi:hypothetical protein
MKNGKRPRFVMLLLTITIMASTLPITVMAGNPMLFHLLVNTAAQQAVPGEKQMRIDQIARNKCVVSTRQMTIDTSSLRSSTIDVDLGDPKVMTVRLVNTSRDSSGALMWYGEAVENRLDHATIVYRGGKVSGSIISGKRIFEIVPIDDAGGHLLVQKDFKGIKECNTKD